jgi:hypothetical protein
LDRDNKKNIAKKSMRRKCERQRKEWERKRVDNDASGSKKKKKRETLPLFLRHKKSGSLVS